MRKISLWLPFLALLACAGTVAAQDHSSSYEDEDGWYDEDYDDYEDEDRSYPEQPRPPAGADVAYDYLRGEYYPYAGAPARPAESREQEGFRDGQIRREPSTSYYAGVRLVYPDSGRRHRCGCRHGRETRDRDVRARDEANAYPFTYSSGTRRYTDQHVGGGKGHW